MHKTLQFALLTLSVIGTAVVVNAADGGEEPRPQIGQIRALAIDPGGAEVITELHHSGWLEARGQLLSVRDFPELYKTIGRAWTSDTAPEGHFAIPEVDDSVRRGRSAVNPFGVLDPSDLVSGGRTARRWVRQEPLSYWIFVGRDLTGIDLKALTRH